MKPFLIGYWLVGSLLCGTSIAYHENKCPDSPEISAVETLTFVAIWPAAFSYAIVKDGAPKCKPPLGVYYIPSTNYQTNTQLFSHDDNTLPLR